MRSLTPGHLHIADQTILRAVAVAYRTCQAQGVEREGIYFRTAEDMALAAAHAEFVHQGEGTEGIGPVSLG
jgi:hypothetical protein